MSTTYDPVAVDEKNGAYDWLVRVERGGTVIVPGLRRLRTGERTVTVLTPSESPMDRQRFAPIRVQCDVCDRHFPPRAIRLDVVTMCVHCAGRRHG